MMRAFLDSSDLFSAAYPPSGGAIEQTLGVNVVTPGDMLAIIRLNE